MVELEAVVRLASQSRAGRSDLWQPEMLSRFPSPLLSSFYASGYANACVSAYLKMGLSEMLKRPLMVVGRVLLYSASPASWALLQMSWC